MAGFFCYNREDRRDAEEILLSLRLPVSAVNKKGPAEGGTINYNWCM